MKSNTLALMLVAVLLITTLGNAWFVFSYRLSLHKMASLQKPLVEVNGVRNVLQSLGVDVMEYSKKNKDIDPLLQSVGLKAPGPATTAPAGATTTPPIKPLTK